jgi:diguanylate cyclase (GGDEF)-like protein
MHDDRGQPIWHTDHEFAPCPDFVSAARLVVDHLDRNALLDLWWVTEVTEADQIVVASAGAWSNEFSAGTTLPWLESYCLQMAAGRAPAVTPRLRTFVRDTDPGGGWWVRAGGYTGAPLVHGDGELFGTLAGFSGRTDDPQIVGSASKVRLLARMLSTILASQLDSAGLREELAVSWELSETDALTGLRNRRGWEEGLAHERRRGARGGNGVIAIDLDGLKETNDAQGHQAGDRLLARTAEVLAATCRPSDVLARSGGDEFAVLAVGVSSADLGALAARLRAQLRDAGIRASLAGEAQIPGESLVDTWGRADRTMYAEKRRRHSLPR